MSGVQYTCETELGLFVKITSKMLFEAGWLISLLCWLRPYSFIISTNKSHLLVSGPSSISFSSQLKPGRLKSPPITHYMCLYSFIVYQYHYESRLTIHSENSDVNRKKP